MNLESLRITFLVDKSSPFYIGGYENRVWNIAKRLATKNDVTVLTSLDSPTKTIERVDFRRVCTTAFQREVTGTRSLPHSLLFSLSMFRDQLSTFDPQVLIVEAIPYLHLKTMKRWVLRHKTLRVLNVNEAWFRYSYVVGFGSYSSAWLIRSLLKEGLDWSDLAIAISTATADSLKENFQSRNVATVPMGIDIARTAKLCSAINRSEQYDFVTVGRLVRMKRHADLVKALDQFKRALGWSGRAAIVGQGPEAEGLRGLVKKLGLSQQIDLLGFLPDEERFRVLRSSSYFVLPSEREGFSLATLEALAAGTPAIVARPRSPEVFGVKDLVTDGVNGLYYECGNIASLVFALRRALGERQHGISSWQAAATETANEFDWDRIVPQLETELRLRIT